MPSTKQLARYTANALPAYRVYAGIRTAELLAPEGKYHNPEDRTWDFAERVLFDAATDMVDGALARWAGPSRLGGYLDQIADKIWFLTIARQLARNDEIRQDAFVIPLSRDVGLTAVRPLAQLVGLNSDARYSGKIKMGSQVAATLAACSPIAPEYPEFVSGLFDVASGLSVVSGLETVGSYASQVRERLINEPEPAARLVLAATTDLALLRAS
jgi:phosphatidylglycerophosphate synthase